MEDGRGLMEDCIAIKFLGDSNRVQAHNRLGIGG